MATEPPLPPEALSDERSDHVYSALAKQTEAEAIYILLTLHKLAETTAKGRTRELLGVEAAVIFHLLGRFAPGPLNDACAIWNEHAHPPP